MLRRNLPAAAAVVLLLVLWQLACALSLVPEYMLPSPAAVVQAFCRDSRLLWQNSIVTLQEAFCGLFCGVAAGFVAAVVMDACPVLMRAFYPLLVITQTVPSVAVAPLLVLWFGYGIAPKIVLIVITVFFPIAVGLLDGFRSVDKDAVNLLRSMGAGSGQIFRFLKLPSALPQLFSGLKIAAAYSVVGAVISEWLGGFEGLGVYMTRVKKAYATDRMFAVIYLISALSLALMALVKYLEKKCMPYRHSGEEKEN